MFKKPKIGVDIDGVILDQTPQIVLFAKSMFDIDMSIQRMTEFDISKTQPINRTQLHEIFRNPEYLASLDTIDDADVALMLLSLQYWIEIVSSRSSSITDETIASLQKHNIQYDMMFLSVTDKLEHAKLNKIEYFVEDRYKNAVELATYCKKVFLMDYLYNRNRPLPNNVIRVRTWMEILSYLLPNEDKRLIGYDNGTIRTITQNSNF